MTRTIRKSVGIIGLGIIGRRIADHLRHQGLSVFVWNRTPRPVTNFVGSPAELAQTCNYLQIFVSDDDALMRMIQTISMSLTPRHIVIAHPTVSPDTMREAAALVERRGARLVEAPFTGSKLASEKGQLVYYVSGDEAAVNEVRPLLQASSKTIVGIGAIGDASIIKIATNMVTAASVQGAAEAMAIVHYSGIPLEKFADALKQNASNSATLDLKVPRIISADLAERQPDLFSPRPVAVPHESPEFVEEQLAKLEATQIGQPPAEPPPPEEQLVAEEQLIAEERQKPVDIETPRQTQPQPEETTALDTPSNGDSEPEEDKRGFFSRLLRRTDY